MDASIGPYARLLRSFLKQYLAQARELDEADLGAIQPALQASVGHGAAALAYSLWKIRSERDSDLLDVADRWIVAARASGRRGGLECELEDWDVRRSFMHGVSGISLTEMLVANARGEPRRADRAMKSCLRSAAVTGGASELFFGLAGRVVGTLLVHQATGDAGALELAERLMRRLMRSPRGGSPTWTREEDPAFAHGQAGAIYALTSAARATGRALPAWLEETIASWVATVRASSYAKTPRVRHWRLSSLCGGASGWVLTLSRAYEATGVGAHLTEARRLARVVVDPRGQLNATVCCGAAGRSYALLALHRVDPEGGWLVRACEALAPFLGPIETDTPLGILQGYAGVACAAFDLLGTSRDASRAGLPFLIR